MVEVCDIKSVKKCHVLFEWPLGRQDDKSKRFMTIDVLLKHVHHLDITTFLSQQRFTLSISHSNPRVNPIKIKFVVPNQDEMCSKLFHCE